MHTDTRMHTPKPFSLQGLSAREHSDSVSVLMAAGVSREGPGEQLTAEKRVVLFGGYPLLLVQRDTLSPV